MMCPGQLDQYPLGHLCVDHYPLVLSISVKVVQPEGCTVHLLIVQSEPVDIGI